MLWMMHGLSACLLVSWSLAVKPAEAFSWTKPRLPTQEPDIEGGTASSSIVSAELALSGLKPDEVEILFLRTNALDDYARKPDCFKRAAGLVRSRCGEADMDEHERVKVSTARHHSVPMECQVFGSGAASITESNPEDCVENDDVVHAMIPEPCPGVRNFGQVTLDIFVKSTKQLLTNIQKRNCVTRSDGGTTSAPMISDTAKDIYRNATLEKMALIRFMANREKTLDRSQEQWKALGEVGTPASSSLRHTAASLDGASRDVLRMMKDTFQDSSMMLHASLADVEHRMQTGTAQYMSQMGTAVDAISERHALALSAVMQSMEVTLSSRLEVVFLPYKQRNEEMLALTAVSQLSDVAIHAAEHLDAYSQQAQVAHETQIEASRSVAELSQVVRQLTTTAHTELESINNTALALRDGLRASDAGWIDSSVLPLIRMILHVDAAHFDDLTRIPMFKIGLAIFRIACYFSQSAWTPRSPLRRGNFVHFALTCDTAGREERALSFGRSDWAASFVDGV
ncbi:hypothetical protein GLOTRDRAFT_94693 [Gloeophyllum trabeum ATCC 11539]|uniref:Karyogamy protein 5 n=1 Tax=Gloeophyllum trabeum (strain ATCC 11539 / FP-39264 / Madison 617) TaxID=670483 RepID=S7Q1N5_GLOTA|nr:uncharacterized protein GLOTRDRAFT_94693 [Gloeophyllum trabeum ATCC 11539]EPQ53442.1 hypothetical protein GLOTRDRAFT_94693 [Gloeophyllum trabeum ATCC 11539]